MNDQYQPKFSASERRAPRRNPSVQPDAAPPRRRPEGAQTRQGTAGNQGYGATTQQPRRRPDGKPVRRSPEEAHASPRRRKRRHPYAHLVKPGLILLGVLVVLIILIVDLVSFKIVIDADEVTYVEYGEQEQVQVNAKVKGGLWGLSWKAKATPTSEIDTSKLGEYQVTYEVEGTAFLLIFPRTIKTTLTHTVVVRDTKAPVITLRTSDVASTYPGATYLEEGYTAMDNCDGDITASVTSYQEGDQVFYSVTDASGNTGTAVRTIRYRDGVTANGKTIYLTFDDGPGQYTEELLDVLAKYNVKVTFFVVGTDYIHLIKRIADEGHTVALHSYSHRLKQIYQSESKYYADLELLQDELVKYTGQRSNILRFPGGSSNVLSDYNPGIMSRLSRSVQENGYIYFDWNVDSFDAGGADTPDEVFENVKKGCEERDNSIVLQHDIKEYSVDAVERIVVWGLENGYTFRPLDENSPKCHHKIAN